MQTWPAFFFFVNIFILISLTLSRGQPITKFFIYFLSNLFLIHVIYFIEIPFFIFAIL